jgi:hypothetical protein
MNAASPASDPQLKISNGSLAWDADRGGWKVVPDRGKIRMNIVTPKDSAGNFTAAPWLNVEITGYFRIVSTSDSREELTLYSRGGQHNDSVPCEGTAYKAGAKFLGDVFVEKEVFHGANGAGYTDNPQKRGVSHFWDGFTIGSSRWVGVKALIYNTQVNGNPAVRTEIWLDTAGDNTWQFATAAVDVRTRTANGFPSGDWTTNDPVPAACGWDSGYVALTGTTPGRESWATYRADDATIMVDCLAIREIDPAMRLVQP